MNMAENNIRFLNERLFARKGQAMPAVLSAHSHEVDTIVADACQCDGGVGAAANHARQPRRSPLSFLIQRRATEGDDRSPPASGMEKHGPTPAPRVPDPKPGIVFLESVRGEPGDFEPDRKGHEPRRQLTVRLAQNDFQRVKSLAGGWGETYQSFLEKCVRSYVLSVQAAERARKATTTPLRWPR
jgi:hypothetical protein